MITLTIQANNFQELIAMLRDVPMGNVSPSKSVAEVAVPELPVAYVITEAPITPAAAVILPGAETDSSGTVWNAEIHSSSKAKNKDGTWRRKRGIDDDASAAPVQQGIPPVQPIPAAPVATPVTAPTIDYNTLMNLVGAKMMEGKLSNASLGTIMVEYGITNFQELIPRPDLIPTIYAKVYAL
jgi:hypothetical protein